MKQASIVILLLLAIFPAHAQDRQPGSVCRFEIKYNREADMTTIQCDNLVKWGEAPAGLTVQANTSFRGKESNETAKFWFLLSANKGVPTRNSRPIFQNATTFCLSIDSALIEIPVKDYSTTYFELVRSRAESGCAELSREDLQKLLDAKNLAGKWGGVEFKFSDAALASLKDFISRQVFATDAR